MSLRIVDSLVSGILARPSGFSGVSFDELNSAISTLYTPDDDDENILLAQYHLVDIMDQVVRRVYGAKTVSVAVAEDLLRRLHRWNRSTKGIFGPGFYPAHGKARAQLLGRLGVICVFHFTVTLVVRPFYISALSARMTRKLDQPEEEPAHAKLASICVDYAVMPLRVCLEAHEAGLLYTNMFIMK